jgi:hypothetical protein
MGVFSLKFCNVVYDVTAVGGRLRQHRVLHPQCCTDEGTTRSRRGSMEYLNPMTCIPSPIIGKVRKIAGVARETFCAKVVLKKSRRLGFARLMGEI